MRSRTLLILVFVFALSASGLFLWMSRGDAGSRGGSSEISGPVPQATEPARLPAELDEVEAPPQELQRAAVVEPATKRLGEEAIQGAPQGRRENRVQGRVVDEQGQPVEGAAVSAGPSNELIFELDSDLPFLAAGRSETTTDEEGEFTLDVSHSGAMSFGVRADGFAPFRRKDVPVSPAGPTRLEDFQLTRGVLLSGFVVDENGSGVAGAELLELGPRRSGPSFGFGMQKAVGTTAADGSFRLTQLAAGPYRILVKSEEHPDQQFVGLADEPGQEYGGLTWPLKPGSEISGRVLGIPASEAGQLQVQATPAEEGFGAFERRRLGDVDANGTFTVLGLTQDTPYDLVVTRQSEHGFPLLRGSRSEVTRAQSGDRGVSLQYQPEGAVGFQVMDAVTRQPIERFTVHAGTVRPAPLRDERGALLSEHAGGRVLFGGLRPRGEDRVRLEVNAPGYREFVRDGIALRTGQELDLGQIFLDPVPTLRVSVLTLDGTPIEGANVRLQRDTGGRLEISRSIDITADGPSEEVSVGDGRSARTNEMGVAQLNSYPGELCQLIVRASGFAPKTEDHTLPDRPVSDIEVRVSRGGNVLVEVLDSNGNPLPGARVGHREPRKGTQGTEFMMGELGGMHPTVADSEGFARFENLQEGVHSFRIQEGREDVLFGGSEMLVFHGVGAEGGEEWRDIQVLEGETAELTLMATPRGRLMGTVLEAGDELAGATLRLEEDKETDESDPMALAMASFGGGGITTQSNGKGEFEFDDVKVGRYILTVSHPTRRMPDEFEVQVLEGRNSSDIDLPISIIEGRITDSEGKPLAGLTVRAERVREESGGPSSRMVMMFATDDGEDTVLSDGSQVLGDKVETDADGRYTLRGVLPDVELVVKAEGAEVQPGSSAKLRVAPNEIRSGVDFQLEAGGAIELEVLAADGSPARMVVVTASHLEEADVDPRTEFVQRGNARMSGLAPGRWSLSARKVGPASSGDPLTQEVFVRPGQAVPATLRFAD